MDNQKFLFVFIGGFHDSKITDNFVDYLYSEIRLFNNFLSIIIPSNKVQPYDGLSAYNFLFNYVNNCLNYSPSIILITFSAGVVGGVMLGKLWEDKGGKVDCLLAFDGWGVPLMTGFPCYRLSHDYFTHVSSSLLGGNENGFYAEPEVEHLDLWRSPLGIEGWWEMKQGVKKAVKMRDFIEFCLNNHCENFVKKCE